MFVSSILSPAIYTKVETQLFLDKAFLSRTTIAMEHYALVRRSDIQRASLGLGLAMVLYLSASMKSPLILTSGNPDMSDCPPDFPFTWQEQLSYNATQVCKYIVKSKLPDDFVPDFANIFLIGPPYFQDVSSLNWKPIDSPYFCYILAS